MAKIKISCDESTTICDKNQYGNASFLEKIKMTFHVVHCKVCKCYGKQNTTMTKVYEEYSSEQCKNSKCLSKEEKHEMEKSVKEKME